MDDTYTNAIQIVAELVTKLIMTVCAMTGSYAAGKHHGAAGGRKLGNSCGDDRMPQNITL